MKANLLRAEIVARDMTIASLAEAIGMKLKTMYNKMNGGSQFTVDEAVRICDVLKISDDEKKVHIFLT